jgi:hypothetical protein
MAEELGRIEKPAVDSFKKGRKLFFVPVIYQGEGLTGDYVEKWNRYWEQVEKQLEELSSKLGEVKKIFHELISVSGKEGVESIKALNAGSYKIVSDFQEKSAQFAAMEDAEILAEFMDWSRCLMIGLESQKVVAQVYDSYTETGKKRNEAIARKIDESLKENEIGVALMRENHHVQFPADIQVFYVAPPALDEIKRWIREYESKAVKEAAEEIKKEQDKESGTEPDKNPEKQE